MTCCDSYDFSEKVLCGTGGHTPHPSIVAWICRLPYSMARSLDGRARPAANNTRNLRCSAVGPHGGATASAAAARPASAAAAAAAVHAARCPTCIVERNTSVAVLFQCDLTHSHDCLAPAR